MAPTDTGSPGADTPDFRTAAVRDKGITPATLDPRTPCLGILTDGQCDACVLRVSPMDYEGYFPAVQLIVPDLVEQNIGGAVVRSCRNRRTDGAHRHAALGALAEGSVCGLGTVPYRAILKGRRGGGSELNPGYFLDQVHYLRSAERQVSMPSLFDALETEKVAA